MKAAHTILGAIVTIATVTSPLHAQPASTPTPTPATPTPVPASPDQARTTAQGIAARAKAHFDHGEYAEAIADYREAYRLWPSPGLLYNLGQAYRLVGDCAHASQAYREYLHLTPDSPYRATVEQNLSAAEACAKTAEPAPTPTPEPPRPTPTPSPTPVAAPITTTAPVASVGEDDRGHTRRIAGVAVAGGGAVLLVAGAYFARDASSAQRDVASFYAKGGDWADISAIDARGHRDRTLSIVGFAAGGVAIAAGVSLYLLGRDDERAVAIVPTARGGEVLVRWRF